MLHRKGIALTSRPALTSRKSYSDPHFCPGPKESSTAASMTSARIRHLREEGRNDAILHLRLSATGGAGEEGAKEIVERRRATPASPRPGSGLYFK